MTVNESSKLYNALQERDIPPRPLPSKSYQPRRRRPSLAPTPSRTPSMSLHRRANTKPPLPDFKVLPRLEEENASLPPQSTEFILAQIERQNAILDNDPKSVSISSNGLKAHLSTLQNLMNMSKNQPKKKLVKNNSTQDGSLSSNDNTNEIMEQEVEDDDNDNEEEEEEDIDWEFWSAMIDDFSGVALKLPHLVSAKLRAGIPSKVRGLIWQAMSQSASLNLETVYGQLLAEHSPYTRIIQRDLARTFPGVDMFKQEGGDGQKAMERVLTAYSLYDSLVGYCQGLAFLVGPLLMNMSEQQAFCVFVRIMETYEMRTMFTLNMEGLQLRLYQFSSLLAQILPALSDHLGNHSVNAPMYASQWFLTLFAYTFPIPLVLRIYDIVFAEGAAETIMRVAIAMLKRSEDTILQLTEFEDILDYVTSKLYDPYNDDPSQVIADAMDLSGVITGDKMDGLADLYCQELEEEKKQTEQVLAARFNFWSKQQEQRQQKKSPTSPSSTDNNNNNKKKKRESLSWLSGKRPSSASTSSEEELMKNASKQNTTCIAGSGVQDVAMLHQQIEELLLALSQMQKDHLDVKQELVQVRMDKMDMETEVDSLKMTVEEQKQLLSYGSDTATIMMKLQRDNKAMKQRIQELEAQHDMSQDAQRVLVERLVEIQNKYDVMENDKHKAIKELQRWKKRQHDSEHMAQELQQEKLRLIQELEDKQRQIDKSTTGRQQRRRPLSVMLSSNTIDSTKPMNRRHSQVPSTTTSKTRPSPVTPTTTRSSHQQSTPKKSTSSNRQEARCRELEQMLADAKLRIVQLETSSAPTSPAADRPSFDRNDLQKRNSIYGRLWSVLSSQQEQQQQQSPPSSPTVDTHIFSSPTTTVE
ncbi:rab-GTPase-TBC domain-containing protein [Halteromyces radiatus]|uniref:rab-GTPase-TBC domain-containing protein n=1 Tax=Halteromyces radiatus TaxID=101107 RepID=UPI00221EF3B8|nr:rab-GTPase-TBC domain-containing protein [Halteromyces radiatus]KAI8085984.1 rab-GTPase-TBC domain-containing protein [Halteromyces radiatus]